MAADAPTAQPPPSAFRTTRWSLVLSARGKTSPQAFACLEDLCRQYWPPLHAYVRHRGHGAHDAEDLTQEFFARLLAKDWLRAADREKGRFRTFLLVALKRFLANEWDRNQAKKRGGGQVMIPLDGSLEERLAAEAPGDLGSESLYERQWAMTLLEAALQRLRGEYAEAGRLGDYEILKPSLTAERGGIPYDELGAALGLEPASARSAVHRLRKRYREIFREEVAGTVADPTEVDEEMRAVIAALALG